MLSFFPTPYPDESLYSVFARYHIRSGNLSPKNTLNELFGSTSVSAVLDLPACINKLIENMPVNSKYEAEKLIINHTLFPVYTSFLPPKRAEQVLKSMKSDTGGDIYMMTGLMASSVAMNKYLRFCPLCSKEDRENYGEMYWHRIHQIPGILVCPKHKSIIQDSSVEAHGLNKHEYHAASEENCKQDLNSNTYSEDILERLYILAQDAEWLLNNSIVRRDLEWFKEQYLQKLIAKELATPNGGVRQRDLVEDFIKFYGKEFLRIVQSDVDYSNESNWLTMIVRKPKKSMHPIRHLLMARYAGISLEDLFFNKYEYMPFGRGPWMCLNAGSDHYHQPVVKSLNVTYDAKIGKPIGTFTCECGFVYTRQGPDKQEKDKYHIGRIKVFGPVWENKLKELVQVEKLNVRQITLKLNVDAKTVKKYANVLGITVTSESKGNNKVENDEESNNTVGFDKTKERYRNQWLELQNTFPDKSKTELRQINNAAYTWLYRNDKEWLGLNSPDVKVPQKVENRRVDWTERDNELLNHIEIACCEILKSEDKPERITISRIGRKLGILALLEKHLDKMPRTKEYLHSTSESMKDFQIRRIKWAAKHLNDEGEQVKSWKIIRKAQLRPEYAIELQDIIEDEVQKYTI